MEKQLRCVIYTRVSTEEQAQGTSLEVQAAACQRKIESLGGSTAGLFEDAGLSGATYATRAKLQQAIAEIEAGNADVLVCYDVSRLSRDNGHLSTITKRIENAGGTLAFCNFDYKNSAGGNLVLGMSGVLADYERQMMKEKSWNGRVAVVKSGVQTQRSAAPYGYKVINSHDIIKGTHTLDQLGKYEIVEEQAKAVKLMFELYAAGSSLREICRQLQDRDIATPKPARAEAKIQQKVWLTSTVKTIMANTCHIGKATFGKTKTIRDEKYLQEGFKRPFKRQRVAEDEWQYIDCPAIVDKALFDYCNAQMKLAQQRSSLPPDRLYMLGGILYCAKCDRTMMANKRRRHYHKDSDKEWVYRCKNSGRIAIMKDFICNPKIFKGQIIEAQIAEVLCEMASRPKWIEQAYDNFQDALDSDYNETSYQQLKKEMAVLDRTEAAVFDLQLESKMAGASTSIYAKKFSEIALARTELQAKLARFEEMQNTALSREDIGEQAEDLSTTLDVVSNALSAPELAEHEKHALVSTVIEKITADEQGKLVITFRPFAAGTTLTAIVVAGKEPELRFAEQENW